MLPIMSGWNRAPSSLVNAATATALSVSKSCWLRSLMISRPESTPSAPSKTPASLTVSRWLPTTMGAVSPSMPSLTPKTLPISSTRTSSPSSLSHPAKRSLPSLLASLRARRFTPSPSLPTSPISMREPHSLSPFTRSFMLNTPRQTMP